MRSLTSSQLTAFRLLIKKRVYLWVIGLGLAMIFLSTQIMNNPQANIATVFFRGIAIAEVGEPSIQLPVAWVIYLIAPIFIIGTALIELWEKKAILLRGLQYKKRIFFTINLLCIACVTLSYVTLTSVWMYLANCFIRTNDNLKINVKELTLLFICLVLNLLLLLLIHSIISLFNKALGVIGCSFIIIVTPYTKMSLYPLNLTMLSRYQEVPWLKAIVVLILMLILMSTIYYFIFKNKEYK